MTDLNKKQAFWAEQLPSFKENYICLTQLEAVEFNSETGNFDALTKDATGFDLEDILEAYHSVNTGWAMWLRAISQEKAKAQAVPDTHVVVPKELEKDAALKMATDRILYPSSTKDPVWSEIATQTYKEAVEAEKCRLIRDYKEMVKLASESGVEP